MSNEFPNVEEYLTCFVFLLTYEILHIFVWQSVVVQLLYN